MWSVFRRWRKSFVESREKKPNGHLIGLRQFVAELLLIRFSWFRAYILRTWLDSKCLESTPNRIAEFRRRLYSHIIIILIILYIDIRNGFDENVVRHNIYAGRACFFEFRHSEFLIIS